MKNARVNIAGIDYSLRGPSVCIFPGEHVEKFTFDACQIYFLNDVKRYAKKWNHNIFGETFKPWDADEERYESIADWAMDKLIGCERIALEGYSYGSRGNRLFQIAENTGVLKYKIFQTGRPLDIIPPTEVKKFATGKGNANKDQMHVEFVRETSYKIKTEMSPKSKDITNPVSDIVDSYYICKLLYSRLCGWEF